MICAAVSGGPDSMALLYLLESLQTPYFICHVNYHHRPTAGRDEEIVRQFAQKHGRKLLILHPHIDEAAGNFQAQAREVRYAFFAAACKAHHTNIIALGHQQDDALETWMMQKQRGGLYERYGLQTWSQMGDLQLCRPLLNWSKAHIAHELDQRQIAYGIDESNLSDEYLRNRIRHQIIEPADEAQRAQWLKEMEEDNQALQALHQKNEELVRNGLPWTHAVQNEWGWSALDALIFSLIHVHSSKAALCDLLEQLGHGRLVDYHGVRLQVIDGLIKARSDAPAIPFYVGSIKQLEAMAQDQFAYGTFQLGKEGRRIESFSVQEEDFPLLIRPWKAGDHIALRHGTVKISRQLISRKVPALYRQDYMVIEGADGVLFAMDTGCDFHHYVERAPFFMVKFTA